MNRHVMSRILAFAITAGLVCGCIPRHPPHTPQPVPEADASNGKRLYEEYCLACHGRGGKGDGYRLFNPPAPDLPSPSVQKQFDVGVLKTIHEGRPNTAMGAWKWVVSEQEAREVLAYVRSL